MMNALVYNGPGKRSWEEKPRPEIQAPTDAIVRITRTTICGTDLHILKGDVASVTGGRILGHEGVGVVESVGSAVSGFKSSDRVLISCITSCGRCDACKKGMYSPWQIPAMPRNAHYNPRPPAVCAGKVVTLFSCEMSPSNCFSWSFSRFSPPA